MKRRLACHATLIAALLAGVHARAQSGADWPMYNRDLAGTRHSPLDQIHTGNVGELVEAWALVVFSLP